MTQEPMHHEEIMDNLSKLIGWDELNQDFIKKTFHFPDFKETMDFINKIAIIADAQDHHPDILLKYGQATIKLSTHEAQGITQKDFDLAKLIDEVFEDKKK